MQRSLSGLGVESVAGLYYLNRFLLLSLVLLLCLHWTGCHIPNLYLLVYIFTALDWFCHVDPDPYLCLVHASSDSYLVEFRFVLSFLLSMLTWMGILLYCGCTVLVVYRWLQPCRATWFDIRLQLKSYMYTILVLARILRYSYISREVDSMTSLIRVSLTVQIVQQVR